MDDRHAQTESLRYATASGHRAQPYLAAVLPFVLGYIVVGAALQFVSVYALDQYSLYVGRHFDLLLSLIVNGVVTLVATGIVVGVMAWRRSVRSDRQRTYVSLGAGIVLAIGAWAAQAIDVAASWGERDRWGSPIASGVGDVVGIALVLAVPTLLGWWLTRRE